MKQIIFLFIGILMAMQGRAQVSTADSLLAEQLYAKSDSFYQGTRICQRYLDSCIKLNPRMAKAWHEISVPYLKRGDFATWHYYMEKAVTLSPQTMLDVRGWCRFKFLRDYQGAMADLKRFDTLTHNGFRHTGDGSYCLYIVMALCERETGHYQQALRYFALGIDSLKKYNSQTPLGSYDYLHRAVLKLRMNDINGALADLSREEKVYPDLMETSYYKGIALTKLKKYPEARKAFNHASELLRTGFRMTDPYCEIHDTVYPEDISNRLQEIAAL